MKNYKIINLSILICTHKGLKKLPNLLKSIINSSVMPEEIIIVGTSNDDIKYLNKFRDQINLKFFISSTANQVDQRKIGFQKVTKDYILQSDDDIIFKEKTIENLYTEVINKEKLIVCPKIIDESNENADTRWVASYKKYFLLRLIILILNGFRKVKSGTVTLSGRPVGDIDDSDDRQWLNSCLCFSKKNLDNYYSFSDKGKSYYEDVFTSHNFYLKGFQLKKLSNAIIVHNKKGKFTFKEHINSIGNQYKIVNYLNKSKTLFIIDVIFFSIIFLFYK